MAKLFAKSWIFLFAVFFAILLFADFFTDNPAGLSEAPVFDDFVPAKEDVLFESVKITSAVEELLTEEKQNLIDDLKEKIDLVKQQIAELQEENNPEKKDEEQQKEEQEEKTEEENQQEPEQKIYTKTLGGAGTKTNYSKILISEIQLLPLGQRFIELYNPNSQPLSLTGWYLQRKTKTGESFSSLVSSTLFSGKIIGSNDYFLVSRELEGSDILEDITFKAGESLRLKKSRSIVADEIILGQLDSSKSIGRSMGGGFEIFDIPTPRKENKH